MWRGERIGYRQVPIRVADISDRDERNALDERYRMAVEAINPLREDRWSRLHVRAQALGAADYVELIRDAVGIDPDEFANLPSRKQTRNVVFLGRLHHIKGIDLLIRAFALLNDRASTHFGNGTEQLWIIGPDEGEGVALRQLADAMGIGHQVFFPGGMYGSDKVKHLQDAAVLVGMSRYETWGLSFLEALACGTPVIMSEFCQMGKVLPDYCGMVVLFDAESCAKAIYAALDGKIPGTREQRQEWARGYGWPGIAKRIEKVYQEAIR